MNSKQHTLSDEHLKTMNKHGAVLALFTSMNQMSAITDNCFGEEGQFFIDKLKEYGERINTMPKTYEQDGKGYLATAYLHYFVGNCDWYITEKDKGSETDEKPGMQIQAFGMARIHPGDDFELGYINIEEITNAGAELDLHFTPCTLEEVKKKHSAAKPEGDERLDEQRREELHHELSEQEMQALIGGTEVAE